jgi:hypothetical protein
MTAEMHSRPMRRKTKSRKTAVEWFKIKVTASAASVSYRGPGLSRIDPDGDADSVIKIEGTLGQLHGSVLTGGWFDSRDAKAGYYGPFQIVLAATMLEARGKWIGFAQVRTVKAGDLTWTKEVRMEIFSNSYFFPLLQLALLSLFLFALWRECRPLMRYQRPMPRKRSSDPTALTA